MASALKFYIGKGGVGKSTVSALAALSLSAKNKRVLLVSMDPAHNQSDIFEQQFSDQPVKVTDRLSVIEIDVQRWMREYLKRIEIEVSRNYNYLTSFSLDRYFRLLKHSPGLEEYALNLAFHSILNKHGDMDVLIFDMPPTSLALRFFTAPALSLQWTEQLEDLRETIIEKKHIATTIKLGRTEIERDKVLNKLRESSRSYRETLEIFRDADRTQLHVVVNPDTLSWAEADRIAAQTGTLGVNMDTVAVNNTRPEGDKSEESLPPTAAERIRKLSARRRVNIPHGSGGLVGMHNLLDFLRQHPDLLKE